MPLLGARLSIGLSQVAEHAAIAWGGTVLKPESPLQPEPKIRRTTKLWEEQLDSDLKQLQELYEDCWVQPLTETDDVSTIVDLSNSSITQKPGAISVTAVVAN